MKSCCVTSAPLSVSCTRHGYKRVNVGYLKLNSLSTTDTSNSPVFDLDTSHASSARLVYC